MTWEEDSLMQPAVGDWKRTGTHNPHILNGGSLRGKHSLSVGNLRNWRRYVF
jgi:hypothetical protein